MPLVRRIVRGASEEITSHIITVLVVVSVISPHFTLLNKPDWELGLGRRKLSTLRLKLCCNIAVISPRRTYQTTHTQSLSQVHSCWSRQSPSMVKEGTESHDSQEPRSTHQTSACSHAGNHLIPAIGIAGHLFQYICRQPITAVPYGLLPGPSNAL